MKNIAIKIKNDQVVCFMTLIHLSHLFKHRCLFFKYIYTYIYIFFFTKNNVPNLS